MIVISVVDDLIDICGLLHYSNALSHGIHHGDKRHAARLLSRTVILNASSHSLCLVHCLHRLQTCPLPKVPFSRPVDTPPFTSTGLTTYTRVWRIAHAANKYWRRMWRWSTMHLYVDEYSGLWEGTQSNDERVEFGIADRDEGQDTLDFVSIRIK